MVLKASATATILACSGISSPCKPIGVTCAVIPFVVMATGREHILKLFDGGQDGHPFLGMQQHRGELFVGPLVRFFQQCLQYSDLAYVV